MTNTSHTNCSTDAEILREIFKGKWRLAVLQSALTGPVRLSTLRHQMPICSKKMIVDTLHGLERAGWIYRRDLSARRKRVEYDLTSACAEDVRRVVTEVGRKMTS